MSTIELSFEDALGHIIVARPDKLNAIDTTMLAELDSALADIEAHPSCRCVLIEAVAGKAFSVGGDIKEFSGLAAVEMWRRWTREGLRVFDRLARLRQPTIAVIDGLALGGGLELALSCDLRIASPRAAFGSPEVTIATCPGWGATFRLTRLIGPARAKQMILTGELIDAATAAAWGLVNEVAEDAAARARALAAKIMANAPVSAQIAKALVDAVDEPNQAARTLEMLAGAVTASTQDAAEGVRARNEHRPPKFVDG